MDADHLDLPNIKSHNMYSTPMDTGDAAGWNASVAPYIIIRCECVSEP